MNLHLTRVGTISLAPLGLVPLGQVGGTLGGQLGAFGGGSYIPNCMWICFWCCPGTSTPGSERPTGHGIFLLCSAFPS